MPKAELRLGTGPLARFDKLLAARVAGKAVRYLVEEKRHFRHQDAAVVAEQLNRWRAGLPRTHTDDGILLLAPHVREQQATVLERAGIDYIDLAGNVHLDAPGLFVYFQGRRQPKERARGPTRPHKGWVKTVLALLVQPDLANAPYRALADEADVALGTAAKCMSDLTLRGLLQAVFGIGSEEGIEADPDRLDIPIHAFDLVVADERHRGYTSRELSVWLRLWIRRRRSLQRTSRYVTEMS